MTSLEIFNYARGYYTAGEPSIDSGMDEIHSIVEAGDSCQGFMGVAALAGGTGSGFGSRILERLSEEYQELEKAWMPIFPDPWLHSSNLAPYNGILSNDIISEHADVVIPFSNSAIRNSLRSNSEIRAPEFQDLNKIIAKAIMNLTGNLRFVGDFGNSLEEIKNELVVGNLKYLTPACSEIPVRDEIVNTGEGNPLKSLIQGKSQMVEFDPRHYANLKSCAIFRSDVLSKDNEGLISDLKKEAKKYEEFSLGDLRTGLSSYRPLNSSGEEVEEYSSGLTSSNTKGITEFLDSLGHKFDLLIMYKGYLHWYQAEGMEEDQFTAARERLEDLISSYKEA